MPFASGVHAWIEVGGIPLPEHKIQVDQHRTTCFIPSQEGKKFCVRFQNVQQPSVAALRGNVFLDGIAAGAGLLLATDSHAASISGQTRWEGFESPFQFARLKTTDDEAQACKDEARLRDLGTIRIQIEWVNIVRQEAWHPPSTSVSADQPIHERSKKASSHCTTLGDLELSRPKHWYSTIRAPSTVPFEFVFQYAPLDWLLAQDIVSDPSSSPTSSRVEKRRSSVGVDPDSEDALSELLDEEEAIVYQRLKAKLAERQKIKRRKTVKQEPRDPPRADLGKSCEVIDLTGEV